MSQIFTVRKGEGNALTIIDPQFDFVSKGGKLYVEGLPEEPNRQTTVIHICVLCNLHPFPFDYLAVSEDDHPENHIEFRLFPPHCVRGTAGQKYYYPLRFLHQRADERIVKGNDPEIIAYSIATSSSFPAHVAQLRARSIRRVFLAGWAYTHCVGESAIAYATQGFDTFVLRDATRSVPSPYGDPDGMNQKLALYGVREIFCHQIT